MNLGRAGELTLNCYYEVRPLAGTNFLSPNACSGWVIGTTCRYDCVNATGNTGVFQTIPTGRLWHSTFDFINVPFGAGVLYPDSNPATSAAGATAYNCVFSFAGALPVGFGGSKVNFVNTAGNLGGNCYFNVTTRTGTGGYDSDANKVEVPSRPLAGAQPDTSSPLFRAGVALPGGYVLEFDQRWQTRLSPPTIGPLDGLNVPSSSGSGFSGRLGGM